MSFKQSVKQFIKVNKIYRPFRQYFKGIGTILALHRVVNSDLKNRIPDNASMEVLPEYLEMVIKYFLDQKYEVITLDTFYDRITRSDIRKPFVCFTFDDGYIDNYEIVYPLFKKYELPFTIYVTNSFPNKTAVLWWYMLEDLVLQNSRVEFEFEKKYTFQSENLNNKISTWSTIRQLILGCKIDLQNNLLTTIFNNYGIDPNDYMHLTLNWKQIKYLANDPLVTIGVHTLNHFNLKKLSSHKVNDEIINSKIELENKIGKKIEHFAYPFGTINEAGLREFEIAKSCNFKTMTTTREGNIFLEHKKYLERLPRISIGSNDMTDLEMKMSGIQSLARKFFSK